MSRSLPGALALLGMGMTAQLILEAALPAAAVPGAYALTLIHLHHRYGSRWRVEGAFWSGLLMGMMLRQPPGAYAFAAILSMEASTVVRGSLARRSSVSTLLEVLTAVLVLDITLVLLLGRPALVCLPSYVVPVMVRAALTGALYALLSLIAGLSRLVLQPPAAK